MHIHWQGRNIARKAPNNFRRPRDVAQGRATRRWPGSHTLPLCLVLEIARRFASGFWGPRWASQSQKSLRFQCAKSEMVPSTRGCRKLQLRGVAHTVTVTLCFASCVFSPPPPFGSTPYGPLSSKTVCADASPACSASSAAFQRPVHPFALSASRHTAQRRPFFRIASKDFSTSTVESLKPSSVCTYPMVL